jgi:putative membrane protein
MIKNFNEHSANERTFLAWVRTGIAVIAFGFVLEKFDLFIRALAANAPAALNSAVKLDRLTGWSRYEGLSFMALGVVVLGLGYLRFARTERMIEDPAPRQTTGVTAEIAVTLILMLLVTAYCVSIVAG